MDEYKHFYYKNRTYMLEMNAGDLTKQKEVRTRLKCHDFKWYMETVAFDLVNYYPPVEPPPYAYGEIRSEAGDYCIVGVASL
jgi:hypothetical protein